MEFLPEGAHGFLLAPIGPIFVTALYVFGHFLSNAFYDVRDVNSMEKFKDDLFFCQPDQIYLYKKVVKWNTFGERCFVMPVKNNNALELQKEKKNVGILKYGNKFLEAQGINEGDVVVFPNNREFEFLIDKQRLYCIHNDDILIKYEYKGNEEEYNPSWAKSG